MARLTKLVACALCAMSAACAGAFAQDAEFVPETFGVKEAIDPGPNLFVNQQEWSGAGSINVYSADDLTYKGNMSAGSMGQILISPDGAKAYSQSSYLKRIAYGEHEQVLQVFDVATLSPEREVILPNKAAMVAAYDPLLTQSADGKLIYVQNATPATSVTVVDIEAGEVLQEVPTPGCWGVYPSLGGYGFSSICGDGTFASFALGPDGMAAEKTTSEKIFDVDADALFVPAQRIDGMLAFMSFNGNVYILDDSTGTITLSETFSITQGTEGGWAPGGYGLMAYNAANDVLFVTMHSEAYDGSHKNASEEIWAYDMEARELLYQSPVHGIISITVTDDEVPVIYALNEEDGAVVRYDVDPEAKFVLKESAEHGDTGFATVLTVKP